MKVWGLGIGLVWMGVSWGGSNWYFKDQLRQRGQWVVRGSGPLWDSMWVARHIEAHGKSGRGWDVWSLWVDLCEQQLFEKQAFWMEADFTYRLWLQTRVPVAVVRLPGRLLYIDSQGRLLPYTRSLDLPILEMPRWDSLAVAFFLEWWQTDTLFYRLTSHISQDSRRVWYGYGQIFPEQFVLGRTEDLPQARRQWYYYHSLVRSRLGSNTCKSVLLHIPKQIICQKS